MMLRSIPLIVCAILGLGCSAEAGTDPTSRTLLQVIWDIGAVNEDQAQIERELGQDPLALIELPDSSGWFKGMSGPEMREVNLNIADWYVLDSSGLRGGAFFSVWCDNGNLYLDLIQARGLKNAEGTATVEREWDLLRSHDSARRLGGTRVRYKLMTDNLRFLSLGLNLKYHFQPAHGEHA